MDLDKILKIAETSFKDYMIFFIRFFGIRLPAEIQDEYQWRKIKLHDGRFWMFFFAGCIITNLTLMTATGKKYDFYPNAMSATIVFVCKICLFSLITHIVLKLLSGEALFYDTISVCLLGSSAITVIASMITLSITYIFLPLMEGDTTRAGVVGLLYIFVKVILVGIYIPRKLNEDHKLNKFQVTLATLSIPLIFLTLDVIYTPIFFKLIWT